MLTTAPVAPTLRIHPRALRRLQLPPPPRGSERVHQPLILKATRNVGDGAEHPVRAVVRLTCAHFHSTDTAARYVRYL
eukprot:CAMPEP_0177792628 /NCGR_PEP_ID=MMETSP0491_2-20121128/24630_1 /TAXON_ID=63592 /ORGANISM="Tetraselmis chuii, Strain PLY429" /LENGTH=77 /DNA_ID=CAMNT_0019315063 /DNA_START=79 /DNA_END=312 /DNA_ORIENTATION=-